MIELLIVIAIIGILATVASVSLLQARRRARDTKRVSDIQQVRNGFLIYSNQRATYPAAPEAGLVLGSADARCLDDSDAGFRATCGGAGELRIMERVPSDISPTQEYRYRRTGPLSYELEFTLEGRVEDFEGLCHATQEKITCP